MRMEGVRDGEGGLFVRLAFWYLRRRLGYVPAPQRIYAHHPKIMKGFGSLARTVEKSDALQTRVKRLVMYWTARLVECPF